MPMQVPLGFTGQCCLTVDPRGTFASSWEPNPIDTLPGLLGSLVWVARPPFGHPDLGLILSSVVGSSKEPNPS